MNLWVRFLSSYFGVIGFLLAMFICVGICETPVVRVLATMAAVALAVQVMVRA